MEFSLFLLCDLRMNLIICTIKSVTKVKSHILKLEFVYGVEVARRFPLLVKLPLFNPLTVLLDFIRKSCTYTLIHTYIYITNMTRRAVNLFPHFSSLSSSQPYNTRRHISGKCVYVHVISERQIIFTKRMRACNEKGGRLKVAFISIAMAKSH